MWLRQPSRLQLVLESSPGVREEHAISQIGRLDINCCGYCNGSIRAGWPGLNIVVDTCIPLVSRSRCRAFFSGHGGNMPVAIFSCWIVDSVIYWVLWLMVSFAM